MYIPGYCFWLILYHVNFQSPCCNKIYPCRVCHDEKENHEIDRKSVTQVKCVKCQRLQKVMIMSVKRFLKVSEWIYSFKIIIYYSLFEKNHFVYVKIDDLFYSLNWDNIYKQFGRMFVHLFVHTQQDNVINARSG